MSASSSLGRSRSPSQAAQRRAWSSFAPVIDPDRSTTSARCSGGRATSPATGGTTSSNMQWRSCSCSTARRWYSGRTRAFMCGSFNDSHWHDQRPPKAAKPYGFKPAPPAVDEGPDPATEPHQPTVPAVGIQRTRGAVDVPTKRSRTRDRRVTGLGRGVVLLAGIWILGLIAIGAVVGFGRRVDESRESQVVIAQLRNEGNALVQIAFNPATAGKTDTPLPAETLRAADPGEERDQSLPGDALASGHGRRAGADRGPHPAQLPPRRPDVRARRRRTLPGGRAAAGEKQPARRSRGRSERRAHPGGHSLRHSGGRVEDSGLDRHALSRSSRC